MRTDDLIRELAADLTPIRRVAPPWKATLGWVGLALLVVGAGVALSGFRHDLH